MKTRLIVAIAVSSFIFSGCGEDEKKSSGIKGDWEIIDAVGVEWEENDGNTGAGTVINTNDPDVDMIGEVFDIESAEITLFGGTYDFEYSDGVISIDFDGEIEEFNVEFDGTKTMIWTQDEPTAHSDYEYNDGGDNYLFYQKTFTLERE